jgi:hypothetical protein
MATGHSTTRGERAERFCVACRSSLGFLTLDAYAAGGRRCAPCAVAAQAPGAAHTLDEAIIAAVRAAHTLDEAVDFAKARLVRRGADVHAVVLLSPAIERAVTRAWAARAHRAGG